MKRRWNRRRIALVAYLAVVSVALVLVGLAERDIISRFGGIEVVGPCRDLGPEAPECKRQARLILKSICVQGLLPGRLCEVFEPDARPYETFPGSTSDPVLERFSEEGGDAIGTGNPPGGQPGPPPGGPPPDAPTPPPAQQPNPGGGGSSPPSIVDQAQDTANQTIDTAQGTTNQAVDDIQGSVCQQAGICP